jgi:hypothetical protein
MYVYMPALVHAPSAVTACAFLQVAGQLQYQLLTAHRAIVALGTRAKTQPCMLG